MRVVRIHLKYFAAGLARGPVQNPARYRDRREVKFVCGPAAKVLLSIIDTDGPFRQEWRLNGPACSLCITSGPNQIIFVGSVGCIYKLDLSGKIIGEFGSLWQIARAVRLDTSPRLSGREDIVSGREV
jgi:hypothetical protein